MKKVERKGVYHCKKIHKCGAIRPGVFIEVLNLIFFCLPVKWHWVYLTDKHHYNINIIMQQLKMGFSFYSDCSIIL